MAYSFTAANLQYLTATGITSTALSPMTLACWARPYTDGRSAGTASQLISVQQAGTAQRNTLATILSPSSTFRCAANAVGAITNGAADTVVVASANSWSHFASVFTSSTSRTSYVAGGSPVTNTTDIGTQLSGDIVRIAVRFGVSLGTYGNGDICEVGVWSASLTAIEIASLACGVTCDLVRPQSLVFYAPLIRDLVDVRGGVILTNTNGATVSNHTRVYA